MKISPAIVVFISSILPKPSIGSNSHVRGVTEETLLVEQNISDISNDRLPTEYFENATDFPQVSDSFLFWNDARSNNGTVRGYDADTHGKIQKKDVPQITGGKNAARGRYPYYAVSNPWGCGASVIGKFALLTAAHCAVSGVFFHKVDVGIYSWTDDFGNAIRIRKVIPHPKFNPDNFDYDYAVIILNHKDVIEKQAKYEPVCLARTRYSPGESTKFLTVIGFGSTKVNRADKVVELESPKESREGRQVEILKYANVRHLDNKSCSIRNKGHMISKRMICTHGPYNRDACQGDSGGPLIKAGKTADRDVLVGIVSWGYGCGVNPGVYADVADQWVWITRQVQRNSGGALADKSLCKILQKRLIEPPPLSLPQITEGKDAPRGRYPYYAASKPWGCGASLIGRFALLTAAHCVSMFYYNVDVGLQSWTDPDRGHSIRIKKVLLHPKYTWNSFDYDYAIIILNKQDILEKRAEYKPICMARRRFSLTKRDKFLRVLGFGSTDVKRESKTKKLQYADVKHLDNKSCSIKNRGDVISRRMICTDGPYNRDACQGDSGGPLIKAGKGPNTDVLVGVVSWGYGCGTSPGVYANVADQWLWITRQIRRHGGGILANSKLCKRLQRQLS